METINKLRKRKPMCNFFSFIRTRNGGNLYHQLTDSHTDILVLHGIPDKKQPELADFVRLEYSPKGDIFDIDSYVLKVDQSITPSWFDDEQREQAEAFARGIVRKVIMTKSENLVIGRKVICDRYDIGSFDNGICLYFNKGTLGNFRGGTLNDFYGGTLNHFNGGTLGNFRGGTLSRFNGGTLNDFLGGTLKIFNCGTLKNFNGGTLNDFNGGTLNHFWCSILNNFNGGALIHFNSGTLNDFWGGTLNHFWGGTIKVLHKDAVIKNWHGGTIERIEGTIINDRREGK